MSTEKVYLRDQEYNKKRALWPFMKRIFTYGLRHGRWFYQLGIFTLFSAAIDATYPLVWSHFIDDFIQPTVSQIDSQGNTPIDWGKLQFFGFIYLAMSSLQALSFSAWMFATGRIREHVIHDLRRDMFEKLQHLSHSFYDKVASGWITIRLTSDVDKVAQVISWGFISLVYGVSMILASLLVMIFFNITLTMIVVMTVPVLLFLAIRIRLLLLKHARLARKLYSEMAANLTENINGIEVNKATIQEVRAGQNFRKITEDFRDAAYKAGYYTAMYNPVVVMTGSIAAALVIYLGGHMVAQEYTGVSVGVLAAFFSYSVMIFEPIFDITYYYATAQDSLSAGERIFSLIDEPVEIKDQNDVKDFEIIRGDIEMKNLDFHYLPEKPIITHLNLKIQAGQSIALVGPTGEGKSTIASLICRFYEPIQGQILIDGVDYRERTLASYRSQLGVIQQTPFLFSGTIRENIRYGKLDANEDEIKHALEIIGAYDFMDRLDEQVGEEGNNLSLGERQLISFARAIIKNPRILIMDEATSSVDTLTEARIQKGVEKIIRGRTSIIIAHRLSTIKNCDRILVIRKGEVAEDGSHEELLQLQGAYYQLYTRQRREQFV
ncbi:MAG: ABC transporter ATP-binding protein [Microscillaceae bacterium]|nr:ABC transporter ATP-binding protein [Microscillaceae bacterium]